MNYESEQMKIAEKCVLESRRLFDEGYTTILVTDIEGAKEERRLFRKNGELYVFRRKSRKWGNHLNVYYAREWTDVKPVKANKEKTVYEWFIFNLTSYKRSFTKRVHPNLWTNIQEGYAKLDVADFEAYIANSDGLEKENRWRLHDALREYCTARDIQNLVFENRYKITTIKSNAPKGYGSNYGYQDCLRNIKSHLDNREKFSYYWQSEYDVSVSGNTGEDGVYRAWLSLEFRGCGSGHYYLLINENSAVFTEDD